MQKIVSICFGVGALGATIIAGGHLVQRPPVRTERVNDFTVSGSGAETIKLNVPITSVDIETGNSSEVKVHAVRSTKYPDSAGGKRWMDAHLTVVRDGDTVKIEDKLEPQNGHGDDDSNRGGNLELHITAPRDLALNFRVGAGTVKPDGQFKSIEVQLGAGSFDGHLSLSGRDASSVHVGAGEVKLNLPGNASLDVQARAGVGEIKGLPGKSPSKGSMHIGDNRAGRFGSGGRSLMVNVGAGSIDVMSSAQASPLSTGADTETENDAKAERILSRDDDDMSMDQMGVDIGPSIAQALSESQVVVAEALAQSKPEMDKDLADVGPEVRKALAQAMPEVDKELAKIGPEIDRALKEAQPEIDRAMKEAQPDIDRAMKEAQPEIAKAMAKIGPEIKRALEKARPEIERAQREHRSDMKKLMPEIEKAMKQAQAEIEKAGRDLEKQSKNNSEMSESIRKAVREAMKAAQEAIHESMKSLKSMKDES